MKTSNETEPQKVVIVTYNIHNLGGVPKSTSTIANSFYRRGHEVDLISISPGIVPMSQAIDSGIRQLTCNSEVPRAQRFIASGFGARLRMLITGAFRKWKPRNLSFVKPNRAGVERLARFLEVLPQKKTVMIVTDVNSMDYVSMAFDLNSRARPTVIGQFRGTVEALAPSRVRRIVDTYSNVDLILTLTSEDAEQLQKFTNVKTSFIANPVPEANSSILGTNKTNSLVTMGRLAPEKGIDKGITAWARIAQNYPEWCLKIYGDGPLYGSLTDLVRTLGIEGRVSFEGKTTQPLLALRSAGVHLLPSQHEGFGMSIAEAASVGTPTLAFDCSPGVRSQITHGVNGVLVPLNNVDAMADALSHLIEHPDTRHRMGEEAMTSVQRFGVDQTMNRWETVLEEAHSRHAARR